MNLKTKRLVLRPFKEDDAESLYEYAKDPAIGPIAGWPVHTSVENSRDIIAGVLSAEETYAVCTDDRAIGSVGILIGGNSNLRIAADEAEIGYWIGKPYWGQGLIPEATREIMRYAFEHLGMNALWSGYFDGNEKSRRVQEKCGFKFHHTEYEKPWPLINAVKTQHVTRITKSAWELENIIKEQYQKYPRMANQDAVKLVYQNEFGAGHLAPEEAASLQRINEEFAGLSDKGGEDFEYIGSGLCRLHLRTLRNGLAPATLNRFFLNTAQKSRGNTESFREKLVLLNIDPNMEEGIPRHSETYRAAYAPAYRLVDKAYCDFLPLFRAIDALADQKERLIIAIDGNSAAGKSTLANLLQGVYDANVFSMDDFFLQPHQRNPERLNTPGGNVDYPRFFEEILAPLTKGESVTYRPYNCHTLELSAPKQASPKKINIVEGVYSLHPRLIDAYDIKVFLSIDEDKQKRRLMARNEELYDRFLGEWIPMENQYFSAFDIRESCDYIFNI